MTEIKESGFSKLHKKAKNKPKYELEVQEEKKVDWKKVFRLVIKILEPELRKMHKAWVLVPISFLFFAGYGVYHSVLFLINLFNN